MPTLTEGGAMASLTRVETRTFRAQRSPALPELASRFSGDPHPASFESHSPGCAQKPAGGVPADPRDPGGVPLDIRYGLVTVGGMGGNNDPFQHASVTDRQYLHTPTLPISRAKQKNTSIMQ